MKPAPILLFCYKRVDTLKKCIASLQKCPEVIHSALIIVSDYAANDADIEKVEAVRNFLPTITGFKTIEIIERNKNLGVDYNIIQGIKMVADRFPKFIVVEDDLVVQDGFLNFLNSSLDFYGNNPEVLTITGFSFVDKIPNNYAYDGYFAKRTCPWGWATWAHKITDVDWEIKDKHDFLKSREIRNNFNKWGSDRSGMLIKTLTGKIKAWDIRLDYHQFKFGLCTLYPVASFVDNIGFGDNDACNTIGYNRFKTKLKCSKKDNFKFLESILYDERITKKIIRKNSLQQRFFTRIMKLIGYKN